MTDKPPAMPELPEPFALSLSIHDGENCKWPLLECRLLQKHPAEKQHLYTADQMRAYALAAQQSQPAAPQGVLMRLAAIAAECSDPDTTDALDALIASTPEQPAAAGVSDAEWDGAEEWMPLAWELCAEEHGEEACNELIWTGGPIPEPWGDRWLQYEDEAKRLIALVRKHVPALRPQAVPMMDEPFLKVHKGEICYKSDADDQSYGMWCPVNWDTEHGFSDGTVFYAHHGITQRADGGEVDRG